MKDGTYELGDKVFYKDHQVHVLKQNGNHVRIQDEGREFVVDISTISPIPEGVNINQRGKVGVGSVIPKEIRARYVVHKGVKTAGGSNAIDNNDQVALELRSRPLDEVYEFAANHLKTYGITTSVAELKARYNKLNVGMQRMNLGNLIRGAGRKLEAEKRKAEAKAKRDEAKAKADAEKKAKADAKAAEPQNAPATGEAPKAKAKPKGKKEAVAA